MDALEDGVVDRVGLRNRGLWQYRHRDRMQAANWTSATAKYVTSSPHGGLVTYPLWRKGIHQAILAAGLEIATWLWRWRPAPPRPASPGGVNAAGMAVP